MNRKDITNLITKTLISSKLIFFAKEVTFDFGTTHPKRVDVIQFVPNGTTYASDIEKGEFICYEVKSNYQDLYSGSGLNFFGEKNYIVTTMELAKKIQEDKRSGKLQDYLKEHFPESSLNFGLMVLIPNHIAKNDTQALYEEFNNPTELDRCDCWKIITLEPCYSKHRTRGSVEMLFCMLRAKHNSTNFESDELTELGVI